MGISNLAVIFGPTILVPANVSSIELATGLLFGSFLDSKNFYPAFGFFSWKKLFSLEIPKITKIITVLIHEFPVVFSTSESKEEITDDTSLLKLMLKERTNFSHQKIEKYLEIFQKNDISFDLISDLNHETLIEMEISSIGDRNCFIEWIQSYNITFDRFANPQVK